MIRRSFVRTSLGIVSVFAAVGCGSSPPVDLGHSTPPAVLGASLTDYEGSWAGYAEAFHFDDDSDNVRLQLDASGNGVLEVGEPDAPPPSLAPTDSSQPDWKPVLSTLVAGFSYPVEGATVTSRRIRIATSSQVAWHDWCSTFTPVADAQTAGNFSCIPNVGWSYAANDPAGCRLGDSAQTPISCASVYCANVCSCSETSCDAHIDGKDVQIDAALMEDGEDLVGTLVTGSERLNIRMTRSD